MEETTKVEEQEEMLDDSTISDILYSLTLTLENLNAIDSAMLSKQQQNQLYNWKDKLWNNIGFYIDCLSQE